MVTLVCTWVCMYVCVVHCLVACYSLQRSCGALRTGVTGMCFVADIML